MLRRLAIALPLACSACEAAPSSIDAEVIDAGAVAPTMVGPAERPARLFAPAAYDGATPLPLVLLLHGYGVDASLQDLYFGMTRAARSGGYYVLLPDGAFDASGNRHWDVRGTEIDDYAYLRGLVVEAMSRVPVLAGEVFVVGHSNGGFMAYRLACDGADLFAGIATLAGSEVEPPCTPSQPVSVLQIHGTADGTVSYDGGTIQGLDYGAIPVVVERWASTAACDVAMAETLPAIDLVSNLDGAETRVTSFRVGCEGADVELWSAEGADHIPPLTPGFSPRVMEWLRAHARR